jgi:hypothetical protein
MRNARALLSSALLLILTFVSTCVRSQTNITASFRVTDLNWSKASLLVQQQDPVASSAGFINAFGSAGDDYASSVQQTSDGGFIVAGFTSGVGAGREDVLLVKLDGLGEIQWAKAAGGAGSDVAYSVRQTSDGGYIVTGSSDSFTGVAQILLAKFDGSGAVQWANTLGNVSDSAAGNSVQQTTDGGYIVTGFHAGALGGLGLLKYDSTGQLQWLRAASATDHYGLSVRQTSDGGYIVSGTSLQGTFFSSSYDLSLLKFDESGNLQWARLAGGGGHEQGSAVRQTSDGGYIVTGHTNSIDRNGRRDVLLLKYDGSGTLQWARTVGGTSGDDADSVEQTSDGGYIVSGRTTSFGAGATGLYLIKFDGAGTLQWARAGGVSTGSSTSVQQTSDGGYLVAGSTTSFGAGGSDILLIKTDANGNIAGCADWSSVSPSIGTTFPSALASFGISSPSLSASARTLSVTVAPLTSNNKCTAVAQPAISVAPTQITFPPTLLNTTSSPVQVTISNTGTANLVISDISTQDPFAITNPSSNITNIAPNTQGTFDVLFRPTTAGSFTGSVTIVSNAPTSPTVIPLQGAVLDPNNPLTTSMFVISNRADASFTIAGSLTFSGTGKVSLFPNLPPGTYTISYGDVPGFLKPPVQTLSLKAGSTLNFVGNYRRLIFVAFPGLGTSATNAVEGMGTLVCEVTGSFPRNPAACIAGTTVVPATIGNTFDWDTPNAGSGSPTDFINSNLGSPEDLVAVVGHSYGGDRARRYANYLRSVYTFPPDMLVTIDSVDPNVCTPAILGGYVECFILPPFDPCNQSGAYYDPPPQLKQLSNYVQRFSCIQGYNILGVDPIVVGNLTSHETIDNNADVHTAIRQKFVNALTSPKFVRFSISSVKVSNVTRTSATVSWNTNQKVGTLLEWAVTSAYGVVFYDPSLALAHGVAISGLRPSTTYHFSVISPVTSNQKPSTNDSTFTTLQ